VKELFKDVCQLKQNVLKLKHENLKEFKTKFYQKEIAQWQLDLIWEYFWGDKEYEDVVFILKNKKII
jgi:hypothetical protein